MNFNAFNLWENGKRAFFGGVKVFTVAVRSQGLRTATKFCTRNFCNLTVAARSRREDFYVSNR